MGASRTSFAKLQRDRAKKAKAAAKRERRLTGENDVETDEPTVEPTGFLPEGEELSADQLLRLVEELHADFEAKRIDFDTFEERKTELFARISVD
ncbi:hypothetical protein [Dermatobacter hominis]|uniref:hypothetical protein n=1 Tax=Dermatobacter hominis TaxID=2884263 RepID=UPI001D11C7C1|nr:hypothetical protein [Dermatobacter hominis]UDY36517.1 hypothetical protein LH044_03025 [Dermatobacter hominis]